MIRSFLIALQFLTRIPVRFKTEPVESEYRRAIAFYPVVGLLVGLSGMGVYFVSILVFSQPITVVFVLMFLVAITGALHEDGLADCADAFGGGYDRDQILKIMRDSHIGVFGALALVFVLWLKFLLLTPLQGWEFGRCLLLGQILSRWFVLPLAVTLPQARQEGLGKEFSHQLRKLPLLFSSAFTVLLGALLYQWVFLAVLILPFIAVSFLGFLCYRKIRGVTGDCLGAAIQIAELCIYISIVGVIQWMSR